MSQKETKREQETESMLHRNALLRYVIIMFAVALVLVLLSMVLQTQNSNSTISQLHQSSTSALTRAEALQNENRQLEEKLAEQQDKAAALQKQLDASTRERDEAMTQHKNLTAATQALAIVLNGSKNAESPEAYEKAVETVNIMREYLPSQMAALYDAYVEKNLQ